MSEEDIKWLKEVFPQFQNKVLRGVNLDAYAKAELIILGKSSKPECSCSYNNYKQKVDSYYEKWEKKLNT